MYLHQPGARIGLSMASSSVREDVGSVDVTVRVMGGGIEGEATVGFSAVSGTATGMSMSVCLSVCLSVCVCPVCLSVCVSMSVCLSVCVSCLSVCVLVTGMYVHDPNLELLVHACSQDHKVCMAVLYDHGHIFHIA